MSVNPALTTRNNDLAHGLNLGSSLCSFAPKVYEIRVCGRCRASLDWCADDGEGLWPRAWCRGQESHLNILGDRQTDDSPATITVQEVAVV